MHPKLQEVSVESDHLLKDSLLGFFMHLGDDWLLTNWLKQDGDKDGKNKWMPGSIN